MRPTTRFESRLLALKNSFALSLPGRVAEIAATLRRRQDGSEGGGKLPRQFHNLAGTAGTYGFYSIAAVATDGFDECVELGSGRLGETRYLWSILEELENAASSDFIQREDAHLMSGTLQAIEMSGR